MPVSCFSSSAPASQDGASPENIRNCFGALLKACKRPRSASWGEDRIDEFQKNPNFKKISEEEFHKLYKVKKTIGVGGFSIVRKGKHIPSGQDVAIKVIDRSKYDSYDGSLEAEIMVLDKVRHPYCISFKECYFTKKHVYVITELVTGGELLDRVLKKGKYGEQKAARIMKQLLQGVAYLHSIGVMHRDLKRTLKQTVMNPNFNVMELVEVNNFLAFLKLENILLKSHEEDAPIKIADFGLAKIFAGAAPLTTICGSPQYVAPEVLEVGQKRQCYTPAADLWSIGVIMYILLSGFSPFDDANEAILFQKIKKGMYSMKQPVWETVSYEGKDLMQRLLMTKPEKRLTAKQALRHPWFQIQLMEDPMVDHPEKQGTSGDPQERNEVVSKQLEQQIEARQEVVEKSEEQLPASPKTEPGEALAALQITTSNNEDQVTQKLTAVQQQNMSDNVHAPQDIDEKPEILVQELGEKMETIVQEIVEQLGTMVEASGEKPEITIVQQDQEPTDYHEVQELKSQEEIGNIAETETRSAS